jgi:chemotaxis protein MotB
MARQGWENALDDDLLARSSSSGFWSGLLRWLVGLFIVGTLTAGAAYYLPLHRAHKALTEQYAVLQKRADADDAELKKTKTDLASAEADRNKLKDEHGEQEARQKAAKDQGGKLRDVLTTKLAGYARSHLVVTARGDMAAVLFPPALVRMQGAEITESGKTSLCTVIKSMSTAGPLSYRVGAYVAHADAAAAGPREQAAGRATSAARALEEKCAVPGTRILAAGFLEAPSTGDGAPGGGGDDLELDVAPLDSH